MNKKQFSLLACTALLCACQPAQKQTTITGTLTGMESDTLIVNYFAVSDLSRRTLNTDTVALQEGKFTCQLENDSVPMEVYFYAKPRNGAPMKLLRKSMGVVAFPGETVELSGSMDEYHMKGNAFHQAYEKVRALCKPYEDKMHEITQVIMGMQSDGTLTPERLDSLRQIYEPINADMKKVKEDYIRQHPDEDISVYLISDLGKEAGDFLDLIGEKAQNGPMAPLYKAMKEAIERQKAREEARKNMVEGAVAPDFTLKDLQGKDLTLSSLRGKYVVLDFWGSWCGWCIKGIPDMKKYYEKYKDRMEILGVDCRDTEEKWKAAVEKYELPWLHVRNTDETDITVKYGIQGYPTKIVIDPEGKVAKIVIGEDPAFYKYLDELFK